MPTPAPTAIEPVAPTRRKKKTAEEEPVLVSAMAEMTTENKDAPSIPADGRKEAGAESAAPTRKVNRKRQQFKNDDEEQLNQAAPPSEVIPQGLGSSEKPEGQQDPGSDTSDSDTDSENDDGDAVSAARHRRAAREQRRQTRQQERQADH